MTTKRSIFRLFVFTCIAWLPSLIASNAVKNISNLYHLANLANPYFVPDYAVSLYLWTPLVVMSASFLFLSPGLFLSIALNAAQGIGQWILTALSLSIIVVSVVTGIIQSLMGSSLIGINFAAVVVGCSLVCFGIILIRLAKGHTLAWPLSHPYEFVSLLSIIVIPFLILISLTPKFYWENFNGDGVHAFEATRLLLVQPLPFWKTTAGDIASFPGINSMLFTFPGSWYIRLYGAVEASARLPILLYLVGLYGAVLALVEYGRNKPVLLAERLLIWLGIIIYTVVMAFSATYNPYFADIALPATQDTLLMVCFLGFILSFLKKQRKWEILFIGLTMFSVANGLLLIGFWLLSVIFVWKPRPWNQVAMSSSIVLGVLIFSLIAPYILNLINQPLPGREHGVTGLLTRFAFLQWSDWQRIMYMIIPCGVLPGVAIFAWRWQDHVSRALSVVTIGYFIFFYIQAHISLHYFVPVMILPLIVLWRSGLLIRPHIRPLILTISLITGIFALIISLPENVVLHTEGRTVGRAIEDRIGGYDSFEPAVFKRSEILSYILPYTWDPSVPLESYGGSPLIWIYYAHQKYGKDRIVNYVLLPADQPAPAGMTLLAKEGDVALYLRSHSIWEKHKAIRPATPAGSKIYAVPRGILFRSVPLKGGPEIINMVDFIESLGIDMNPILNYLKVKR